MYVKVYILLFSELSYSTRYHMSEKLRFLFRKGIIDVILYLEEVDEAGYYEIYKQGFVVSRQTFANLLKLLEEKGIVEREVIDDRPPRVNYSLTENGIKMSEILISLKQIMI